MTTTDTTDTDTTQEIFSVKDLFIGHGIDPEAPTPTDYEHCCAYHENEEKFSDTLNRVLYITSKVNRLYNLENMPRNSSVSDHQSKIINIQTGLSKAQTLARKVEDILGIMMHLTPCEDKPIILEDAEPVGEPTTEPDTESTIETDTDNNAEADSTTGNMGEEQDSQSQAGESEEDSGDAQEEQSEAGHSNGTEESTASTTVPGESATGEGAEAPGGTNSAGKADGGSDREDQEQES